MPLWLAPAIGAGASLIGQGLSALSQSRANKESREWNEHMYATQRRDSLADWNMMNEYNSPASQMKRFKEAGLNPHLIYGQTNTASPVRSSDTGSYKPIAPQYEGGFVSTAIGQYQDLKLKAAQTDNVQAATDLAKLEGLVKTAQVANIAATTDKTKQDTDRGRFELDLAKSLRTLTVEAAEANLRKMMAETQSTLDSNYRAGIATQLSINADERAAVQQQLNIQQNTMSIQKAAEEILTLRLGRAKTQDERRMIEQQIQNAKQDKDLKQLEEDLRRQGVNPGDGVWWRMLRELFRRWNGEPDPYLKKGFENPNR